MSQNPESSTPVTSPKELALHGWTAVPRDPDLLFGGKPFLHQPPPVSVDEIPYPSDDPLVASVQTYVKEHLSEPTYNHSMRVYYFGYVIMKYQFPAHCASLSLSTWALTTLLHDIGTSPANLRSTLLSFEFHGGLLALDLLKYHKAPQAQAEAVAEAIIRHQDLGTTGEITFLGQLIQLATIYDNMGGRPELVDNLTRGQILSKWPRMAWSQCFCGTIREETGLKPWCHTTALGEEFPRGVLSNKLMAEYEM